MISARLINYLLLENKEHSYYTSIAYDENYFYACLKNKTGISKLDLHGCICNTIETQDMYKSICFDKKENCFWTIKENCSYYIYKLDHEFREVDSFIFKDLYYDYIDNISYKTSDDTLLLSGQSSIYNVSKQGKPLFQHNFSDNNLIMSSGEIGKSLIKCTQFREGFPITVNMILQNYCEENLNCIPVRHRVISIFPISYDVNNNHFYIAAVKNNQFTYLFKYELINVYENKLCSEGTIQDTKHTGDDDDNNFICVSDIKIF